MNFQPSELTIQVAQTARDFAQQYIKPHVMDWDETQEFPVHVFKEMGKTGHDGCTGTRTIRRHWLWLF